MKMKVADLVEYKGEIVRVMNIKDDRITLAKFGEIRKDDDTIKLVESVILPKLQKGDRVIVHDIPESEKHTYGCFWSNHMEHIVGEVATVRDLHSTDGIVKIGGWNFYTYHLEPVNPRLTNNYDMV